VEAARRVRELMMMHESWIGTFIQGMVMGTGMMVVMMVPAACRVIARCMERTSLRGPKGRSNRVASARVASATPAEQRLQSRPAEQRLQSRAPRVSSPGFTGVTATIGRG
jgi:hypothetical protein